MERLPVVPVFSLNPWSWPPWGCNEELNYDHTFTIQDVEQSPDSY